MDRLLERNRESAKRLHWSPWDFGTSRFDRHLVNRIREFQRDRFLRVTGVVDNMTLSAALSYRLGLKDYKPRAKTERNLRHLGSVRRLKKGDPRVLRSAPFVGRTLYVDTDVDEDAVDMINGDPSILETIDVVAASFHNLGKIEGDVRRLAVCLVDFDRPWAYARDLAAMANEAKHLDGIVVIVPDEQIEEVMKADGKPFVDFLESYTARATLPFAIQADVPRVPLPFKGNRYPKMIKYEALRHLQAFDATLPPVPAAYRSTAIEYAVGQVVSQWSIRARLKPQWCYPVYIPEPYSSPNEVHRFRDWIKFRGIRGHGWAGPIEGPLWQAFCEPLPKDIARIDYDPDDSGD